MPRPPHLAFVGGFGVRMGLRDFLHLFRWQVTFQPAQQGGDCCGRGNGVEFGVFGESGDEIRLVAAGRRLLVRGGGRS